MDLEGTERTDLADDLRRQGHAPKNGEHDCPDLSHRADRSRRKDSQSDRHYSRKPEREVLGNDDGARRTAFLDDVDGSEKSDAPRSSFRSSYGGNGWQEHSRNSSSSPFWDETERGAARNPGRYRGDGEIFSMSQGDGGDNAQEGAPLCLPEEINACRGPSSKGLGRGEEGTDSLMFLSKRLLPSITDGAREPVSSSPVLKGFGLSRNGSRFTRPSPGDTKNSTLRPSHSPSPRNAFEAKGGFQEGKDVSQAFNLHGWLTKEQQLASFQVETVSEEADIGIRKWVSSHKSEWSRDLVDPIAVRGSHDEGSTEGNAEPSIAVALSAKKAEPEKVRAAQEVAIDVLAPEVNVCEKLELTEKIDIKNKGADGAEGEKVGAENGGGSCKDVDIALVQPEGRPLEKVEEFHGPVFPACRVGGIEKEEGELLDEVLFKEEPREQNTVNLNEEQRAVDTKMAEEQESEGLACALQSRQEDDREPSRSKHNAEDRRALDKEEKGMVLRSDMDLQLQCTRSNVSVQTTDIGESFKGKLASELLFERTFVQDLNQEKLEDVKKELKLSLFTQPGQDSASYPDLEGQTTRCQNVVNDVNKKQLAGLSNMQVRLYEQALGVAVEGKNEPLRYGHKQKEMKLESLQLSLALPGTSGIQAGGNVPLMAGHMEPERSFQSLTQTRTQTMSQTRTNSDGFTTSLSLSQSQSFVHNPSCSLNYMSVDNPELSCGGSRQFSQGNDHMSHRSWPTSEQMSNAGHTVTSVFEDRSTHRRGIPLYQRIQQGGNAPNLQGPPSISKSNYFPHRSHQVMPHRVQASLKVLEASSQDIKGTQSQSDSAKDFPDRLHKQDRWMVPDQQLSSQEMQADMHDPGERRRQEDCLAFSTKRVSRNHNIMGGSNQSNGKLGLHEIATEAVAAIAQKLQELPDNFLEGLKGLANQVLVVFEKRKEFINLQEKIRRRMDLTEETLLLAHRAQLEILVALKTGMQAFVQKGIQQLTNTALIEIFLETKCRNVSCQLSLPVYGCDCRICTQRKDLCHECNCVLCFKFDADTKSCRWVGCDFCMHWCHTDCGLRRLYIAPGPTVESGNEVTEMQYRCVACDHHVELFGFVKQAFLKFAEGWDADVLAKELDCVRRTFHGSEDMRGKQLCFKAEQMLQKLENKVDVGEVCRSMLHYFNEGNAELDGVWRGANNKQSPSSKKRKETLDSIMEALPKVPSLASKRVEEKKARIVLQCSDKVLETKRTEAAELQTEKARNRAEIEDIESVARIKQVESNMFEACAIEARQEASGLRCILSVKRAKIEEDYNGKYAKLRLGEAEERRGKRFEELQALERAQRDYQRMKMRMEGEIKDLLMKMEMTKQQFVQKAA